MVRPVFDKWVRKRKTIKQMQIRMSGVLLLGYFVFSCSLFEGFSQDFGMRQPLMLRRIREVSNSSILDLSFIKDDALLQAIKTDLVDSRLSGPQAIFNSLKRSGVSRVYFIEIPSVDSRAQMDNRPMAARVFPEIREFLKRDYGIDINKDSAGAILLPVSFASVQADIRKTVIEHEATHILKDFDSRIGRDEFVYYSLMQREISNLHLDDATGDEELTRLERKKVEFPGYAGFTYLDYLGSNLGNFMVMRYLIEQDLAKFARPYAEHKLADYGEELKIVKTQEEKEFLFTMAYLLTVTPFELQGKASPLLARLIAISEPYLNQTQREKIISGKLLSLRDLLGREPRPKLSDLRRIIFNPR
jgi:hypothetical protein